MSSLAISLVLAGCASTSDPATSPTSTAPASGAAATSRPAAEPATAGSPTVTPAGRVVHVGNAPEGIVVSAAGIAAVAVRNPDGVALIDAATGVVRQTIPTKGAARHLSLAGPDGPILVPLEGSNELMALAPADGATTFTATNVGHQPHDAVATEDGTIVVTNELGGGVVFVRQGAVAGSIPAGPPQPGGVAALGNYAAVADVQGNGVWVYDATTRQEVAHGSVGVKLTHAIGLTGSLAAFADTDGGAVYVEHVDPTITQVARIDAPDKPYGLAYDQQRQRLYITLTGSNVLRVVDLSEPARPRILGGVPTVQQPNSVAVDPRSGAVLITGSDPGGNSGLQIITADLLPPT